VPTIHPFQGWRYDPDLVGEISQAIAPPYDIISAQEQEALYRRSPFNVVRLILNDAAGEARYTEAARELQAWITQGAIRQDTPEAIYLMDQTFSLHGESVTRTGIIAALELEEMGTHILPHEQTSARHIEDRYRLMEATKANLGQIFMSYRDQSMTVETLADSVRQSRPVVDAVISGHGRYRLWRMTDPAMIRSIREILAATHAIIADGHHRYKTALQYFREHPGVPGSDRVMVTLINAYNPGMQVLPTHRLITGIDMPLDEIRNALERAFIMTELASPEQVIQALHNNGDGEGVRLGFYHRKTATAYLLTFRNQEALDGVFGQAPRVYQSLAVNILHHFILKEIFHLDTENQRDLGRLTYLRGTTPVADWLKEDRDYDVACLVHPPDLETLFAVAEAGLTLPQKTTYFYPKVYSGLVFRIFG